MKVSLCVIAYNEEKCIEALFSDIIAQDYPHEKIEVVLIDGLSTDTTKEKMISFANEDNQFMQVRVLDNPKRIQSAGWNVAISNAIGNVIIRIDAHASIPSDFISKNVACQESGEFISGGVRPSIIDERTPWKSTLLLAETSMFGSGIAPYRNTGGEKIYVKSMFHACYRREVFAEIGGFNEYLGRTEDNEIHYRMHQAGYRFCLDPSIISYQHTRSSLSKMLKQKYGNGYWVGLTLGVCPKCLSIFHFIPFCFIIGIIVSTILAILNIPLLAIVMWGLYWLVAFMMAVASVWHEKKYYQQLFLPFLFFLLHTCYGIGTLIGLIKMPIWTIKTKPLMQVDINAVKNAVHENTIKNL